MNYQLNKINFVHLLHLCVQKKIEVFLFNNESNLSFLDNITVTVRQINEFSHELDNWGMLVITSYEDRVIAQLNTTNNAITSLYDIELHNMVPLKYTRRTVKGNKLRFLNELTTLLEK